MRERIKEIIERENMGQSQFADFIGMNRPTLSHILAGRNNPSLEVIIKIRQKFPHINFDWLIDGKGPYSDSERSVQDGNVDVATLYGSDEHPVPSSATDEGLSSSRFYQGELFAENAVFAAESAGASKNRKEIPLQTPSKAPYLSDTQLEYAKKSLQRKIVEIKIFYDDGTYETFKP